MNNIRKLNLWRDRVTSHSELIEAFLQLFSIVIGSEERNKEIESAIQESDTFPTGLDIHDSQGENNILQIFCRG